MKKGGKKGEGGNKRRRSSGEKEGEDKGEQKRLKKGKLLEELRSLNGARTGVRVRLESEDSHTPSIALFCQKIDRNKKPSRTKPQNDLNSGGFNNCDNL